MANDVKVVISERTVPGKTAFGIPLILAAGQESETAYAVYSKLEELKTLFAEDTAAYKAAKLLFQQSDAPAKIAVCGTDAADVTSTLGDLWDKDWRQLLVVEDKAGDAGGESAVSTIDIAAISNFVEGKKDKMYFSSVKKVADVDESIKQNERTVVMCYGGETEHVPAALVGAAAGLDAGSFTYKNLILSGVKPEILTDSQMDAINEANLIGIVTKAGDVVTSEGKVLNGEYIDIIDSKDYIISNIVYNVQKILNASKKVPYNNTGIATIESAVINVLKDAYNKGIIATDDAGLPDYSTRFLTRAETEVSDRVERKYVGGSFTFNLAGAIHNVEIQGELVF